MEDSGLLIDVDPHRLCSSYPHRLYLVTVNVTVYRLLVSGRYMGQDIAHAYNIPVDHAYNVCLVLRTS